MEGLEVEGGGACLVLCATCNIVQKTIHLNGFKDHGGEGGGRQEDLWHGG